MSTKLNAKAVRDTAALIHELVSAFSVVEDTEIRPPVDSASLVVSSDGSDPAGINGSVLGTGPGYSVLVVSDKTVILSELDGPSLLASFSNRYTAEGIDESKLISFLSSFPAILSSVINTASSDAVNGVLSAFVAASDKIKLIAESAASDSGGEIDISISADGIHVPIPGGLQILTPSISSEMVVESAPPVDSAPMDNPTDPVSSAPPADDPAPTDPLVS